MKSYGLKSLVSNVLLLFFLAGAWPTQALAVVDAQHLQQTWLKSGEQVDAASMDRLLEVMEQDPETVQLLKDITARMGVATPEELIKILSLCKDGENNWGMFYHSPSV